MMFHKNLTPERWFQFSIFEQLANVACDIERTIEWRNKGESEYSELAFFRALELLGLTIVDPKNKGPRLRELCRAREMLIDHFMCDNTYNTTDEEWQRYFYDFSYAAALERERRRQQKKVSSN
jgi:hypothetical protein